MVSVVHSLQALVGRLQSDVHFREFTLRPVNVRRLPAAANPATMSAISTSSGLSSPVDISNAVPTPERKSEIRSLAGLSLGATHSSASSRMVSSGTLSKNST